MGPVPRPGDGSSSRAGVARSPAAGAVDDEEFESSDSDEDDAGHSRPDASTFGQGTFPYPFADEDAAARSQEPAARQ